MSTPTLIVGTWHSLCSACGQPALPHEAAHRTRPGGDDDASGYGCGAAWVAIAVAADAWIHAETRARTWARERGLAYAGRWPRT